MDAALERQRATRGDAATSRGRPPPFPPAGRVFDLALGLLAVLLIAISPLALVAFGLAYDEAGGSPLEKIHPGTILAVALLAVAAAAQGNPLAWLERTVFETPAVAGFALAIGLLMAHTIQVVKLPFTPLIDTFVAPLVVFLLYRRLPEGRGRGLAWLIHIVMIVNAAIGIVEFATGLRVTPLVAAGVVLEEEWRSSALLGHPLANASLTGAYLLMLACGAGRDLPPWLRAVAFALSAAAMVVFGGRAATVMLLAMLAALAGWRLVAVLRGAPFDTRSVLAALVAAPVAGIALTGLAEAGFFDRFAERFVDDQGSADARSYMFELFRHMSWHDLLLGPDARQMETLRTIYGLDFGIESFWIAYLQTNGILVSLVFFAGLLWFCHEVQRTVARGGILVLVFFFAVASTSVSLSAKSPLLAVLVLMMLVLMRRPTGAARS